MKFALVAAVDGKFGLGKNNTLPWRLPADLKHFSKITMSVNAPKKMNAVIMGRRTWESLPKSSQPLKGRLNIVLSRQMDLEFPDGVWLCGSLDEALRRLAKEQGIENAFVIGGGKIFAEAIKHPYCSTVYLTQIEGNFDCDAFFPENYLREHFEQTELSDVQIENNLKFRYAIFKRIH